jgi:hypothetical protein
MVEAGVVDRYPSHSVLHQVRDEYRKDYDPSRGGWGKLKEHHQGVQPTDDMEEEPGNSLC